MGTSVSFFGSIRKSNFLLIFDVFFDLVILVSFTAISIDFYSVKCFIVPRLSRKRGTLKLIRLSLCHENFNLTNIFWSINNRALILGMHDWLWHALSIGTMRWPWPWTYFKVKFVAGRGTTILRICLSAFIIPPATKLGGYTGITLSVCLSVRPSVCRRARLGKIARLGIGCHGGYFVP